MVSPFRPAIANSKGGITIVDEEDTKSIVMEILKSLGKKIMAGEFTDIMRISRPASISYPMTYLQAATRDYSYTQYLNQAAECTDPIRRLQLVLSFMVAGLHVNMIECGNKPPLNPVLGETYTAVKEDGTIIYLEQTCHHPPISHWQMVGPDQSFCFYGHGQIVAGLSGPNTLNAAKQGKHVIDFKDGARLTYIPPSL